MVALGWMDSGSRSLYTKKAVRSPADLKGQKIRMMGNPLFVDTMNAMGGNGIAMGYSEVFSALQTGVIDGAENNPPSLFTANQYTAGIKYYTQTNHLIIPEIFVMSKVTWDKMTPDDQALVKKFSREAQMEQRALWDKSVAEYSAKLKAAGIEFIAIDNKPFYDATAPVRAKYGAPYADLMKRIESGEVGRLCSRRRCCEAPGNVTSRGGRDCHSRPRTTSSRAEDTPDPNQRGEAGASWTTPTSG